MRSDTAVLCHDVLRLLACLANTVPFGGWSGKAALALALQCRFAHWGPASVTPVCTCAVALVSELAGDNVGHGRCRGPGLGLLLWQSRSCTTASGPQQHALSVLHHSATCRLLTLTCACAVALV